MPLIRCNVRYVSYFAALSSTHRGPVHGSFHLRRPADTRPHRAWDQHVNEVLTTCCVAPTIFATTKSAQRPWVRRGAFNGSCTDPDLVPSVVRPTVIQDELARRNLEQMHLSNYLRALKTRSLSLLSQKFGFSPWGHDVARQFDNEQHRCPIQFLQLQHVQKGGQIYNRNMV